MPQKNDFNFVRAIDAQDNSVRVTKEEFAKHLPEATLENKGAMSPKQLLNLGRYTESVGYYKLASAKVHWGQYFGILGVASPASSLGTIVAINWRSGIVKASYLVPNSLSSFKVYTGRNGENYELWVSTQGADGIVTELCSKANDFYVKREKLSVVSSKPSYLEEVSISSATSVMTL